MNLDYRIAWVEDQPRNVTGLRRNIETYLADQGFNPRIDMHTEWADIERLIGSSRASEYDLFLVDWKLMGGHDGIHVSGEIRRHKVFAEIVFYSSDAKANIRSEIHKAQIDGVFCADRNNDLEEIAHRVIDTTIKKVVDLENMRGIFTAAVGRFDNLFRKVIAARLPNSRTELKDSILTIVKGEMKSRQRGLEKLEQMEVEALLIQNAVTSSILHRVVCDTLKPSALHLNINSQLDILNSRFPEEVAQVRNKLAHAEPDIENGKKILRIKNEVRSLDQEYFQQLRRTLLDHDRNLSEIVAAVESAATQAARASS